MSSAIVPPLRQTAAKIIARAVSGTKIQEAFSQAVEKAALSSQDRQLCADLAYGVLRQNIRIQFILRHFLKAPSKLPQNMLFLLALGVYGLLFQDRTPPYAVINETVEIIKKEFGNPLARVANGILRNIQKKREELLEPEWYLERCPDSLSAYCIFYSIPAPVARLWREAYGMDQALMLMRRSSQRPWQGLRLNPRHEECQKLASALKAMEKVEAAGQFGYAFPPGSLPQELAGRPLAFWQEMGALSMQSPGSMLVMYELGLASLDGPVWDACAGSGIKTAALLERGVELSLASDISMQRLQNMTPFCDRLGLKTPMLAQMSAGQPALARWDGHIIADVPCSGLGVLARRPDIREGIFQDGFWKEQAKTQEAIVESLAELLQTGKKLVYISCTLNPAENELQIRKILDKRPELELVREWQTPHDHPWLEGMYGAVLEKKI